MKVVYVTGNENKAKYFNKMVGLEIAHQKVDVAEAQSLDARTVVSEKANAAFEAIKQPVIVEDTYLKFNAMGQLPGTYIKWFLEELGSEGLCKMLNFCEDRSAVAGALIAYYDGRNLEIFESSLDGTIANEPHGSSGFGWNSIFIPREEQQTLGEMDEDNFVRCYRKIKPFNEIRKYLLKITK